MSLVECRSTWTEKCKADPIHGENGQCVSFVRQEVKRGNGTMDEYVKNYCAISSDPLCSCVAVPLNVARGMNDMNISHGPIYCWYKECTIDKLLTLGLFKDASSANCTTPHCRLGPSDFDMDGNHTGCPENKDDWWFKPFDPVTIKRHTAFLTQPVFKK